MLNKKEKQTESIQLFSGFSDKQLKLLEGGNVKSVLITAGTGYKGKRYVKKNSKIYRYKYDGLRRRRNLRGNTISTDTRQLNLKVLEYGKKSLGSILGDEEE